MKALLVLIPLLSLAACDTGPECPEGYTPHHRSTVIVGSDGKSYTSFSTECLPVVKP